MLTQMKIFTSKPFEREGDFLFFKYVKKNDTELCLSMLAKKKYYIYDFNYVKIYIFFNIFIFELE